MVYTSFTRLIEPSADFRYVIVARRALANIRIYHYT